MSKIVTAFYREPIIFLGVVLAVFTTLGAEGVIAGWIAALAIAVCVFLQRHFVSPVDQA